MKIFSILLILISLTIQTGCSPLDSIDEMGERQEEAREATIMVYNDQRQAATSKGRADILICMKNPICNPALIDKIKDAGRYYWAAEFQFWKNFMGDLWQRRFELFNSGVKLFFLDMKGFVLNGDHKTIDPTKLSNKKRAALNAFAMQMHQVNTHQEKAADRQGGGDAYSMLDLIKNGLEARERIRNGEKLEDYKHQVVYNEELAIYMLKLRYNFTSVLVATKLGDLDRGGKFKVILRLLTIIGKSFVGGSWSPDLSKINSEELKEWNGWLRDALDARDFLRSIGEQADLHWKAKKIFKTLELPEDGYSDFTDLERYRHQEFIDLKNDLIENW